MAEKVELIYFEGRGKMESIRWLLAVAEVEFDEVFLTTHAQYCKLLDDGALMFQQVPLVKMDGMNLVQTKAILHYIADKYGFHGKDPKERYYVNMYAEGIIDLMEMIMMLPFTAEKQTKLENIEKKAKERYMPAFEKALSGGCSYLVGGKMTYADVLLLEGTLMLEELFPQVLEGCPHLKAFQGRMKQCPAVSKFLQPGSKRKCQPDEKYVKTVMEVFAISKISL